jgi:hypothetical protein
MTDFSGDFDIHEIAEDIPTDHYYPAICEGYGFVAIGKDEEDNIVFAMRKDDYEVDWLPYEQVIV